MFKRKVRLKMIIIFIAFNLVFTVVLSPFIIFYGPFETLKSVAVGSVLTSRHPQVVKAFLSDEKINEIINKNNSVGSGSNVTVQSVDADVDGITIEDIEGNGFKGKVMLIKDPKWIQVAVTKNIGDTGERISDFVRDTGAIAGVTAGGFYDLDGRGNGAYPDGLTVHNGEIVHNNIGNNSTDIVALDNKGKLFVGQITADDVQKENIQEAVSFWPVLVKDGKRGDFNDNQWGLAPRTAIGQKADGTVIFIVIDGRQPTRSLGARMSDLYNIFLKYGAVNAANLDGGSSSELIYNGKVINKLSDPFGERYIATAFVVIPDE